MNPNDPYGQPPSFKTNVNRMKTKRWVEAKSYSYDGDDWGDADDYDEYGGYDDPEPAPAPQKPTGLRQAGQAAGRPGPSSGSGPASDTNRAVSQPPQPPYQQGPRERAGSFTRGDERRAFSGPGGPQASTSPPPPIVNPMRTAYGQALNPDTGGRHPPPMGPGAGAGPGRPGQPPSLYQQPGQARSRPSIDSQGRTPSYDHRSPPPMGRPRQASDGYRSQSMTSNSSDFAGRRDYPSQPMPQPLHPASRPPRKSSLSQEQPSHPFAPSINTSVPPPNEPDAAQTSPASGQTPTLIRPADIYRRMHEEREKERQSQDSSRPSLEGILGNRPSSRDESPSQSGGDGSVARRRSPALGNVAERKSEYGMDGLLSPVSRDGPTPPSRGTSTSPVLPEISGFGEGFGSDFGSSFLGSDKRQSTVPSQPPRMAGNQDKTVQREPSMGFTSAVHQAFDQPAVSETPSSESGSGIGRSNSESTSVISPIISRGPSSATPEQKMKEAEAREQQIPAIEEEPNSASPRNRSIDHTNIPSKSSTHPPGFIPGHRRNVSTPSPDNSPARTPALELTKTLRYPQEIEIAQTTPTTATASNSTASNASRSGAPWDTQAAGLPRQTYNAARESPGPSSRADSPNKGRVRDLAEKINSGSNSRRGSQDSLKVQQEPVRPSNERLESFRPSLPGGWNSYTTNIAPGASREQTPQPVEESRTSIASTPRDISSGPTDAFAAAAAAGSALAGAFASAVGMGGNDSDEHEKSVSGSRSRGNTSLNPESYPQRTLLPHGDSSSSIMPTPLGMADGHDLSQDRDYFANVQPLQSKSRENIVNPPRVSTPPQRIPTMSTDPSPSDLESDKLRKQLVRELSPQAEEFSDEPGRLRPRVTDDSMLSADSAGERQARHDSSLLPSEYDSYWNGSHDGDTSLRVSKQPTQDSYTGNESPAVPQVLPQQDSLMVQSPIADSSLRHKFSWEAESEISAHPTPPMPQKGSVPMPIEMPVEQATSIPPQAASPTVSPPQPHNWNLEPAAGHERELSVASPAPIADTSKDLPQQPRAGSDPNTAVPRMVSSEQLAPSPPAKAKEPAKAGQLRVPSGPDVEFRALAFKEILALKTTEERINMFNTTRSKYAEHRVGLDHWIASTLNSIPDHMDLISRGGAIGTAIKPLVKAPTGGVSTQQPYYQQYLTANSTQGAIGSGSAISSTPSPSGPNKISTQQVQAKGKDILKGAGVLGGKANVAAKGLFAKGKKRFGGGDKAQSRKASAAAPSITSDTTPSRSFQTVSPSTSATAPRAVPFSTPPIQAASPPVRPSTPPPKTTITPSPDTQPDQPDTLERVPPKTPPGQWKLFPTQQTYGRTSPSISHHSKSSQDQKSLVPSSQERQRSPSKPSNTQPRLRSHSSLSNTSRDVTTMRGDSMTADKAAGSRSPGNVSNVSRDGSTVLEAGVSATREFSPVLQIESRQAMPKQEPGAAAPTAQTRIVTTPSKPKAEPESRIADQDLSIQPMLQTATVPAPEPPYIHSPALDDSPTTGFISPHIVQIGQKRRDATTENTPTQADFPPDVSNGAPHSRAAANLGKRKSQALTASPNASNRSSLVLDNPDAPRGVPFDLIKELPKPSVDSPRHGPSLALALPVFDPSKHTILSKDAASPTKSPGSPRPFSFIRFGDVGSEDLSLNNPITPASQKRMGFDTPVSEEARSDHDGEGGILEDKDLESNSNHDLASHHHRRNSSRPFEEPDIQSHPAFRQVDIEQMQHAQPAQSIYSIGQPRVGSQHRTSHSGISGFSGVSAEDREQPEIFPPRVSSRPDIDSNPSQSTTDSSLLGKRKKRASFLSALSGQSDRSKRMSRTLSPMTPTDAQFQQQNVQSPRSMQFSPQPQPTPSPKQQHFVPQQTGNPSDRYGIQQSAYDPRASIDQSPPQTKQKGHRRLLSSAKLLNLASSSSKNTQPEAPAQSQPQPRTKPSLREKPEILEKGKKKRFSDLRGLFAKPHRQQSMQKSPLDSSVTKEVASPPQQQSAYFEQSRPQQYPQYSQSSPQASHNQPSQSHYDQQPDQSHHQQQPTRPPVEAQSSPSHKRQQSQHSHQSYQSPQRSVSYQSQHSPPPQGYPSQAHTNDTYHQRSLSQSHPPQTNSLPASYSQQHQVVPPGAPSPDYFEPEPLDGYYSPDRHIVLPAGVPTNEDLQQQVQVAVTHPTQAPQEQRPHTPPAQISQPQPQHPSPWERRLSSSRPQQPLRSASPPPPPPPPKDAPRSTPQSTPQSAPQSSKARKRSSMTAASKPTPPKSIPVRMHTHTQTSTSTSISSSPAPCRTQSSAPHDPNLSHDANHQLAHSRAHNQALRQTLPPLQTTKPITPRSDPQPVSAPATVNMVAGGSASAGTERTPEELRRARRMEIEMGIAGPRRSVRGGELATPIREGRDKQVVGTMEDYGGSAVGGSAGGGNRGGVGRGKGEVKGSGEEERVVMSSTAYPGQEWRPDLGDWDGQ